MELNAFIKFLLLMFGRKNIFWGKLLQMQILKKLHFLMSPESENHIFAVGPFPSLSDACSLSLL